MSDLLPGRLGLAEARVPQADREGVLWLAWGRLYVAEGCLDALCCPARPLFVGRKPCLPTAPLALGLVQAQSLWQALKDAPIHARADAGPWPAMLPASECPDAAPARLQHRTDNRDWANQIHVGRRQVYEVLIGDSDHG